MYKNQFVTVVIPALNEEKSITKVIADLFSLQGSNAETIVDDIIVCDNNSTDRTYPRAINAECVTTGATGG